MAPSTVRCTTALSALALFAVGCLNNPARPKGDDFDGGDDDGDGDGGAADDARFEMLPPSDARPDVGDGGVVGDGGDGSVGPEGGTSGDGPLEGPSCPPACTPGSKRCGTGGGLQTCTEAGGCAVWGAESSCGDHATCTGAAPSAACACRPAPTGCSDAGQFCQDPNTMATCAKDAQGCVYLMNTAICPPGRACAGTFPNVSCGCANSCGVHGHDHAAAWSSKLPISDLESFWGALGCSCFAF